MFAKASLHGSNNADNGDNADPASPSPRPLTPSLKRRMACWIYEGVLLFGVVLIQHA